MLRFLSKILLLVFPWMSQAAEEPGYRVVQTIDQVEVRQYNPYVVAQVVIDSKPEDAGNLAFPILAGYIFGKNKGERQFEMTAPVTQSRVPMKMEMTAPVTHVNVEGGTQIQFVLPRTVNLESAPEPLDSRIQLRQIPARQWAVIRYSGAWSAANDEWYLSKLRSTLKSNSLSTKGEPVLARYNRPLTPRFMRRNEIWLEMQ